MTNSSEKTFSREVMLLPPRLIAACEFLIKSQIKGRGWSQYPGGEPTLYHTALAASALADADRTKFTGIIAPTVLYARSIFEQRHQHDIFEFADFVLLLRSERHPDNALINDLARILREQIEKTPLSDQNLRLRDFARCVLSILGTESAERQFLSDCAAHLLAFEVVGEGGWAGTIGGKASIIATASVIETLATIGDNETTAAVKRGIKFIEQTIAKDGWKSVTTHHGVFGQATVLAALVGRGLPETIEQGIYVLDNSADATGTWGGGPGETPTVEATAIALKALLACGENRFVSSRIAAAEVFAASQRAKTLEDELLILRRDIEERITAQCGKVVEDRDRLRQENNKLRKDVDNFREKAELRLSSEERYRAMAEFAIGRASSIGHHPFRSQMKQILWIFGGLFGGIGVSLPILLHWGFFTFWTVLTIGILLLCGSAFLVLLGYWGDNMFMRRLSYLRNDLSLEYARPSRVSFIISEFLDITSELPPQVREEFSYTVASRLVEMPPDVGMRSVEHSLEKWRIPSSERRRLIIWISRFLDMDPYSRRAVVEQIRRVALIS